MDEQMMGGQMPQQPINEEMVMQVIGEFQQAVNFAKEAEARGDEAMMQDGQVMLQQAVGYLEQMGITPEEAMQVGGQMEQEAQAVQAGQMMKGAAIQGAEAGYQQGMQAGQQQGMAMEKDRRDGVVTNRARDLAEGIGQPQVPPVGLPQ